MAKKRPLVLLVDSNALIHRAYHALPASMMTAKGELTNAVYGFVSALFHALETIQPDVCICCFDVAGGTFRHVEYDQYKAHRKATEDQLLQQIPRIYEFVRAFGLAVVEKEGYEADDCIGTLAAKYEKIADVIVLTGDKDELQLISSHTSVMMYKHGFKETVLYNTESLQQEYGLNPQEFVVFKALRGDPSDNIPGVRGVGEVGALKLVQTYHTLPALYAALKDDPAKHLLLKGKVREALIQDEKMAELSYKLSLIDRSVPLDHIPAVGDTINPSSEGVLQFLEALEFRSLKNRFLHLMQSRGKPVKEQKQMGKVLLKEEFNHYLGGVAKTAKTVALAFAYTGPDARNGKLLSVAVSPNGKEVTGSLMYPEIVPVLNQVLLNSKIEKHIWDVKSTNHLLQQHDLRITDSFFDVALVDLLLQQRVEGLGPLAQKKETDEEALEQTIANASRTLTLGVELAKTLQSTSMKAVWEEIEKPLVPVLYAMEQKGIEIDSTLLATLSREMEDELADLSQQIWHHAGQQFNISSPQQLSVILFEKLQLKNGGIKKKATGYSTDAGVLESLKSIHPIVPLIMQYREIAKLKGTYVDALPKLIDATDSRLHTTYNQIGAATGRLSSNDPNLQNIPIRTELGQKIRRAFVAGKGATLISLDYSQFELRILAHLSGDKEMQASFQKGLDIHLATAAKLHGVELSAVTKEMRRAAKAVNFGILYGLSAHSLSKSLDIPFNQAKEFIDRYFALYPKVKQFLAGVVASATKDGFYYTLFGRRRLFPELQSSIWSVKQAGERMAMNFPMQGTQADLLKMAMVKVAQAIKDQHLPVSLLLTVHDELVFEADDEQADRVIPILQKTMEDVYTLRVPIEVSAHIGKNWSDMKEVT